MKRYTFIFICALLFFENVNIFCIDYKQWILKSDQNSNPLILQTILAADMETKLTIYKTLGRRRDLAMDDLISSLIDIKYDLKSPSAEPETLLEVFLQSLLDTDYKHEKIELWIRLNPLSFRNLVKHLTVFKHINLKIYIIQLLRFADNHVDTKPYLMTEGQRVLQEVNKQAGRLTPYQKKELNEILETISWWEDKDFLEFCSSLMEICNDRELVKKARKLMKKFLT